MKKIAIITALCLSLAFGAFALTACDGNGEEEEPPRYEYYSFVLDSESDGLILDVAYSGLLPDGALVIPESCYYYAEEEGGEITRHDEPKNIVAIADGAFENCARITSVTLPSALKNIGGEAFKNCRELTAVTLASSVAIGGEAFYGCDSLTRVSGGNISAIGDRAFFGCFDLRSFGSEISASEAGDDAFAYCGVDPMA